MALTMTGKEGELPNEITEAKLRLRVDLGIRELLNEMQQGKSDRLQKYLEFSARFHRYSVFNQMLISQQCPNATFVAGYKKWRELGYQVAKGAKAIRILAPRFNEKTEDEVEDEKRVRHFVAVRVFDASQLANLSEKPLPLFITPLVDDQQELARRLRHVMEEDGIRANKENLGLTQGYS